MRSALLEAWQHGGDGFPLVTRLVLTGSTDSAVALIDSPADLRDVARAVAASISPTLLIEQVKLLVTQPAAPGQVIVCYSLPSLSLPSPPLPHLPTLSPPPLSPFLLPS